MDIANKIRKAVEDEGYEIAHSVESYGERVLGVVILVKMSERKLCDEDGNALYRAAVGIRKDLDTVSAKLDPEGPAKRERYRAEIEKIYRDAGVEAIYMEAKPNGYCSLPCCLNTPWFEVTSRIGRVELGWRKSVMSIDWKNSNVKKTGEELFPDEITTKWESGIHARGAGKAAEYIRTLHVVCVR